MRQISLICSSSTSNNSNHGGLLGNGTCEEKDTKYLMLLLTAFWYYPKFHCYDLSILRHGGYHSNLFSVSTVELICITLLQDQNFYIWFVVRQSRHSFYKSKSFLICRTVRVVTIYLLEHSIKPALANIPKQLRFNDQMTSHWNKNYVFKWGKLKYIKSV